jgi:hypothetical protein
MLGYLETLGDYDAIAGRSTRMRIDDLTIRIISLDDLIKIREYLQRPKDRESLLQLIAIRKIRSEESI